jgi:hypothetical protein
MLLLYARNISRHITKTFSGAIPRKFELVKRQSLLLGSIVHGQTRPRRRLDEALWGAAREEGLWG